MRRVLRITAGSALVVAGTVMLVTPGPGILTIAAGLSILAKDVPAAARMKERVGVKVENARQSLNGKGKKAAPPPASEPIP